MRLAQLASATILAASILTPGTVFAGRARPPRIVPLQFGPTGSVLFVAGYSVDPSAGIAGECDFKHTHTGSGRGGGYKIYTDYYQGACTWDLFGNLVSESFTTTSQAPVPNPPAAVAVLPDRVVYGEDDAGDSTGQTSTTAGFVIHRTPDYAWSPAAQIETPETTPVTFQAVLTSTGDLRLDVGATNVSSSTGQPVEVLDDGCAGHQLRVGQTCTITLEYDPRGIELETAGTTGLDAVHVDLDTDAGLSHPFTQPITISGLGD